MAALILCLVLVAAAVPLGLALTLGVQPSDPNDRAVRRAIEREARLRQQRRAARAREA